MNDPSLVFVGDTAGGRAVLVNFAVHAGREATAAEIDRLGDALLEHVDEAEIVCEQRTEIDRGGRASIYQIRVELPDGHAEQDALVGTVEAWARDCIAERRLI
ncbi:MAG: hypothetical protein H0U90_06950 [Actinobacteria bacterium]|nr:hypothetical protein [Actinomycetota bacterium]